MKDYFPVLAKRQINYLPEEIRTPPIKNSKAAVTGELLARLLYSISEFFVDLASDFVV